MSESNNDLEPSTSQNTVDKTKLTCHLVSLPKIVLTRIDEGKHSVVNLSSTSLKSPAKKVNLKKKLPLASKVSKSKKNLEKSGEKRPKGRPKKDVSLGNVSKPLKRMPVIKSEVLKKNKVIKKVHQKIEKHTNSSVKSMLKKTMLQKKSKIAIPPAKKIKLNQNKPHDVIAPKIKKQVPPKIKLDTTLSKLENTDSSEDEFLYDELIEELENTSSLKKNFPVPVKTTNITLKPNVGNKPPTIVKGGIVKKSSLPADLQVSPFNSSVTKSVVNKQTHKRLQKVKQISSNPKIEDASEGASPAKRPSPWPVSISSPPKSPFPITKTKRKPGPKPKGSIGNLSNTVKTTKDNLKDSSSIHLTSGTTLVNGLSKSTPTDIDKPKIKPKQTAKVVPLSKTLNHDDNLSDEYTEEETLENIDFEQTDLLPKENYSIKNEKDSSATKSFVCNTQSSSDGLKDDEDPNLDLLRILTDESEEPMAVQPLEEPKEKRVQSNKGSSSNTNREKGGETNNPESLASQDSEIANENEEEPPVRTIYDLMSEISLQYPSWNLHIIPETNAFCIAQVTKGRLGLPTLKKCIELDPVDYNAKVYIHQYHIKRFDGVYDSEESIIALIQEINSIKA